MPRNSPDAPAPTASLDANSAAVIQALVGALLAQAPKTPLEMSGLSVDRQRALTRPNEARPTKTVTVVGEHGNRIRVVVSASDKHPHGIVTGLVEYTWPSGTYTHESAGGIVPDGLGILRDGHAPADGREPPFDQLSPLFTHWRSNMVYLVDHRSIIGKPLRPHMVADADDLTGPWTTPVDVAAE